jgi:signal transduction histidine kinase
MTLNPLPLAVCLLLLLGLRAPLRAGPNDTLYVGPEFKCTTAVANSGYRVGDNWPHVRYLSRWHALPNNPFRLEADNRYWIRLIVANRGPLDRTLKLYFHSVLLTHVQLYLDDGTPGDAPLQTGYAVPVAQRATADRDLSVPLVVSAGRSLTVYLSVYRREFPVSLFLNLADPLYGDGTSWVEFCLPMVIGFCLLMVLFAVVLLIHFPRAEYGWYLLYTIAGTGFLVASNGYGAILLWPRAPWFEETSAVVFVSLAMCGFILFARQILKFRQRAAWLDGWMLASVALAGVVVAAALSFGLGGLPGGVYATICILAAIDLVLVVLVIFALVMQKIFVDRQKAYWWFAGIFINLFVLMIFTLLFEAGWIRYSHRLHALLIMINVGLEIFLAQVFLINRLLAWLGQRQQNELLLLQTREQERQQFARNLHDHIASTIHSIQVWAQSLVKRLQADTHAALPLAEKIGYNAGAALRNIRDIEWSVNPRNELGEKLVARLRDEAYEVLTGDTSIDFHLDPRVDELAISPTKRWHLLLVFKESLHNIDKYAGASRIEVWLVLQAGLIWLTVRDDGIGFDPHTAAAPGDRGNGLINMQRSTEELGGRFLLEALPGEGTTVRVGIPV